MAVITKLKERPPRWASRILAWVTRNREIFACSLIGIIVGYVVHVKIYAALEKNQAYLNSRISAYDRLLGVVLGFFAGAIAFGICLWVRHTWENEVSDVKKFRKLWGLPKGIFTAFNDREKTTYRAVVTIWLKKQARVIQKLRQEIKEIQAQISSSSDEDQTKGLIKKFEATLIVLEREEKLWKKGYKVAKRREIVPLLEKRPKDPEEVSIEDFLS